MAKDPNKPRKAWRIEFAENGWLVTALPGGSKIWVAETDQALVKLLKQMR